MEELTVPNTTTERSAWGVIFPAVGVTILALFLALGAPGCRKDAGADHSPQAALREAYDICQRVECPETLPEQIILTQADAGFYEDALRNAKGRYADAQEKNQQTREWVDRYLLPELARRRADGTGVDDTRDVSAQMSAQATQSYQSVVLYVAARQAERKDRRLAETLAPLLDEARKSGDTKGQAEIARIWVQADDFDTARRIVDAAAGPTAVGHQALVRLDIAVAQIASGDRSGARRTIAEMRVLANRTHSKLEKTIASSADALEAFLASREPNSLALEDGEILMRPRMLADRITEDLALGNLTGARRTLQHLKVLGRDADGYDPAGGAESSTIEQIAAGLISPDDPAFEDEGLRRSMAAKAARYLADTHELLIAETEARKGNKAALVAAYQETKDRALPDPLLSDYYVALVTVGELTVANDALGRISSDVIAAMTQLRIANQHASTEVPPIQAITEGRMSSPTNQDVAFVEEHIGELLQNGREAVALRIAAEAGTILGERGAYYLAIAREKASLQGYDVAARWAWGQPDDYVRAHCLLGAVRGWLEKRSEKGL